jgi:hypothetical protein
MTPIQFIDWLDGALDLDELLHLHKGAGQIATELRDMIRNRIQAVERGVELQAAQAEFVQPAPPSHPYSLTRDIKVEVTPPADKLSPETLASIREGIIGRMMNSEPIASAPQPDWTRTLLRGGFTIKRPDPAMGMVSMT